jgi:hypothetical protein
MKPFDIAPYALPGTPAGEFRFEEPRDITTVVVTFASGAPKRIGLEYLQNTWPNERHERVPDKDMTRPSHFGWHPIDDHYNSKWKRAAIQVRKAGRKTLEVTFHRLTREFREFRRYDVTFRRTLGIRLAVPKSAVIEKVQVYTVSPPARSRIRVEFNAGRKTGVRKLDLSAYNAVITRVTGGPAAAVSGGTVRTSGAKPFFFVDVGHMTPAHRYAYDDGLLTFTADDDAFTISMTSLREQGPIWYEDRGVYIRLADDPTTFADYQTRNLDEHTINRQVSNLPEQSLGGAYTGQPRAHAVGCSVGCMRSRHRFWVESNGDVVLTKYNVSAVHAEGAAGMRSVHSKDTPRFKNDGNARFFFGLERWCVLGRHPDPSPVLTYNIHLRDGSIELRQKVFAVPLNRSILSGELAGDDTVVGVLTFELTNTGPQPAVACLPVQYSDNSTRINTSSGGVGIARSWSVNRWRDYNDRMIPLSPREQLTASGGLITGIHKDQPVLRAAYESSIQPRQDGTGIVFEKLLQPGESCRVVLKIPYVAADGPEEIASLRAIDADAGYAEVVRFWQAQGCRGASVHTPEPNLDALHALHLSHTQITDFDVMDGSGLINTTVGTSTYGNCTNESCMINMDLDERGLVEDVRRRLGLWVKYQGTVGLNGNFTDHDGVLYGAGGFEVGATYNQHHGWALWRLADHFLMTGDREWFAGVTDNVIRGADWVFRQRRNTMKPLPFSRGWEYGFLPAGSLEDVTDYHYWLSTNALTWRGTDTAAAALEKFGHPDAARVRRESNAYRKDLIAGFERMRRLSPLVHLRDGRWVPHYPSRLYRRGRDYGWIREVLEGSVYLLISGLYDPCSKQASWILDDFQDNRYMNPPYGYGLPDPAHWFDRGGFSVQPNLLAGLIPHLERDEIEVYLWMFFNAWNACYREEIQAMVEHPMPWLGWSNYAQYKTSDQSNAVSWLRYIFVYSRGRRLHLGRAIPRDWLRKGNDIWANDVATRFGKVSVRYRSAGDDGRITAEVSLDLREQPEELLLRFRHPEKKPMKSVLVNGRPHKRFDAAKEDVDIRGMTGRLLVEAVY